MKKLFKSVGIFWVGLASSASCFSQNTGVGTTSPGSTLHIKNENTNANASPLIIEANSNFGGATYSGIAKGGFQPQILFMILPIGFLFISHYLWHKGMKKENSANKIYTAPIMAGYNL